MHHPDFQLNVTEEPIKVFHCKNTQRSHRLHVFSRCGSNLATNF